MTTPPVSLTARRLLTAATVLAMAIAVALTFAPTNSADAAPTAPSAPPATLHTFTRDWVGHTRSLHIRADRVAHESIYSGCCTRGLDLKLTVSKPRGTTKHGSVRAVVTKVRYVNPDFYGPDNPAPEVGDTTRLTLRRGVLTEPLSGTNYCNDAAARRGVCGA